MKFVSQRKFDLVSTLGHVIGFEKGVPINVPPALHKDAIAAGCVAVDGEVEFDVAKKADPSPADPAERAEMISMALVDMKERNVSSEFNANGTPKVKIVAGITGFDVTAAEVAELWDTLNQGA